MHAVQSGSDLFFAELRRILLLISTERISLLKHQADVSSPSCRVVRKVELVIRTTPKEGNGWHQGDSKAYVVHGLEYMTRRACASATLVNLRDRVDTGLQATIVG